MSETNTLRENQGFLKGFEDKKKWVELLEYKIENSHITKAEQKELADFIDNNRFMEIAELIKAGSFPNELANRYVINKQGAKKRRVVYSFSKDTAITFKFIANYLNRYDCSFEDCCYAFRKGYGVRDAVLRIKRLEAKERLNEQYCLKVDISNYFNSINTKILVDKLDNLLHANDEQVIFNILKKYLMEERVLFEGEIIVEPHGAMAGIPTAPWLANLYMTEVDRLFADMGVNYFRYSDDILLFAKDYNTLMSYQQMLYREFKRLSLKVNHDKECIYEPGGKWEFLGLSFTEGEIDLSDATKMKIKGKIRRKANALMRWQRRKGLSSQKAAKGFIKAMNMKFFGEEDDFTWCRWFFPNITTDKGLKEIDAYMQQYIRYIVTGRHYKGNYRIAYSKLKELGYVSLVNQYYK